VGITVNVIKLCKWIVHSAVEGCKGRERGQWAWRRWNGWIIINNKAIIATDRWTRRPCPLPRVALALCSGCVRALRAPRGAASAACPCGPSPIAKRVPWLCRGRHQCPEQRASGTKGPFRSSAALAARPRASLPPERPSRRCRCGRQAKRRELLVAIRDRSPRRGRQPGGKDRSSPSSRAVSSFRRLSVPTAAQLGVGEQRWHHASGTGPGVFPVRRRHWQPAGTTIHQCHSRPGARVRVRDGCGGRCFPGAAGERRPLLIAEPWSWPPASVAVTQPLRHRKASCWGAARGLLASVRGDLATMLSRVGTYGKSERARAGWEHGGVWQSPTPSWAPSLPRRCSHATRGRWPIPYRSAAAPRRRGPAALRRNTNTSSPLLSREMKSLRKH